MIESVNPYLISPHHPLTVSVIGCGGTGSLVLGKLARLNAALRMAEHPGLMVTAIDGDTVEESNLGRQGFYPSDIGRSKAAVLTERINRCFGYNWRSIPEHVFSVPRCNITFICVDSMDIRRQLYNTDFYESYSRDDQHRRAYIIDCGNTHSSGQVILYAPKGNLRSMLDLFGDAEIAQSHEPSCSTFTTLRDQSLFINDMISTVAVNALYELLSEMQIDYNGIMIDLKTFKFVKIPIHAKKSTTASSENADEGAI